MLIFDKENILPDSSVLEEFIANHPFYNDLVNKLDTVSIKRPSFSEGVHIHTEGSKITLFIYPFQSVDDQNRYILYHEFGHVADRLNPCFKYSEDARQVLSDRQRENFVELWNLYIDARLNRLNIYCHSPGKFRRKVNGQYREVERTQETQLLERVDFLSKRDFNNAPLIVRDIWNHPEKKYTFIDLVNIVKVNMQNP
ncbi:MAG TPA: hypothetical protein VMW72_01720 [Sedimentisphaerales bacterium]|nr:hypothetical protein [Sedimentisphaerales bacterium]